MNVHKCLYLLSRSCFLHEEALLIDKSPSQVDEEILEIFKTEDEQFFCLISLLIKSFHGEKRKDGSSRTLHAYDVARIALEALHFLHPLILKKWGEKETQVLVFSALAHDLLEDGTEIGEKEIAQVFSQEVKDIIFELTIPKQKSYVEGTRLCMQKFNLFSLESASLYSTSFLPDSHFHLPPSIISAYVKLCDTVSCLRANLLRGIPGWDQEKYCALVINFREIVKNLSSLNFFVWQQFQFLSYQLMQVSLCNIPSK